LVEKSSLRIGCRIKVKEDYFSDAFSAAGHLQRPAIREGIVDSLGKRLDLTVRFPGLDASVPFVGRAVEEIVEFPLEEGISALRLGQKFEGDVIQALYKHPLLGDTVYLEDGTWIIL